MNLYYKCTAAVLAAAILAGCSGTAAREQTTAGFATVSQTEDAAVTAAGVDTAFPGDVSGTLTPDKGTQLEITEENTDTDENGVRTCTITEGGGYTLTGEIENCMLVIDADDADVQLILNNVSIETENSPALYVRSAGTVTLVLADGTRNFISDGSDYEYSDGDTDPDGAVFSREDLILCGTGSLTVSGSAHGIVSKDELVILSGNITVNAGKTGIVGKDCVKMRGGSLCVVAGTDGIRSNSDAGEGKGYIYLQGGTVNITAGNDGLQAQTALQNDGADITVTAGEGSNAGTADEESHKGMKAGTEMALNGGYVAVDSLDDAIHANGSIYITGGSYTLATGDDGVHADEALVVRGSADVTIVQSYEGLEACSLTIEDGTLDIAASDDGLNAAGGQDASGGSDPFSSSTGSMTIAGGEITIHAGGDGLDSNGTVEMTGGTVVVIGPIQGDTSLLDYDTAGVITGGTFIGLGSNMMAQNFDTDSTQGAILYTLDTQETGTTVQLADSSGTVLVETVSEQEFNCILISCPGMAQGNTYTLTVGDTAAEITLEETVYSNAGGMQPSGFGGGGMQAPQEAPENQEGNPPEMPDGGENRTLPQPGGQPDAQEGTPSENPERPAEDRSSTAG